MSITLTDKPQFSNRVHFFHKKKGGKGLRFCSCSLDAHQNDVENIQKDPSLKSPLVFFRSQDAGHNLYVDLSEGKPGLEELRQVAARIAKRLSSEQVHEVSLSLESLPLKDKNQALAAMTEGFLMAAYRFDHFKAPDKEGGHKYLKVNFHQKKLLAATKKVFAEAKIMAEGVNFARYMGDCPGNFMTPHQMGEEAKKAAKGTKMKVTVWDKARIAKEKMDSLIGVSNGSSEEPRFIIMEYKGAAASKAPVCFVGKGLTFDSGGISIKPSAGMEEMKFDMCGGSAVIATMATIAKLQLKVNAIAFVPASENMPGPAANKPGDIRKARNGKSIEINNTDAEGRLILADALCYASEKKPAWIVDAATLTGAMMIALGNTHTGFFTRDKKMTTQIQKAGEISGENVWPMPLCDDHSKDMKGHYADLTNLAPSRHAGSATAAAFLEHFVGEDIPWAHFDVAGTAWHVGNRLEYAPKKGASGVMVRTFVELARLHK